MECSSWPESLPQAQQVTNNLRDMPCLTENVKVDRSPTNCVVQPSEMFGETPSIMSYFSVGEVSHHILKNDMHPLFITDDKRLYDTNSVKSIKKKRGCYIRRSSSTSTKETYFIDDGHEWRKYGQKDIINAKHKRNYYRCTHKFDQKCQATKQVQKIEDEPPKYKITYNRHHSCKNFFRSPQIILDTSNIKDTSILLSFESNEPIEKNQVEPHFPTHKHKESNDVFSSIGLRHNQTLSFGNNLPLNLMMANESESMVLVPSVLEDADVISTPVYSPILENGPIFRSNDLCENLFEFAHCEYTDISYF